MTRSPQYDVLQAQSLRPRGLGQGSGVQAPEGQPALRRVPLALFSVLLLVLASFAVPSLASADSVTGQYEEQNWSPTGDSPQKPNYQPGNGSNSGQPTQSGSVSNSPGTAGEGVEPSGNDGTAGNGGDDNQASGNGSGSKGGGNGGAKKNGSAMSSELGDKTVAQVPDASIASPSATDDGGGSSSLIWILIAVLALAGISGGVAMRMRSAKTSE